MLSEWAREREKEREREGEGKWLEREIEAAYRIFVSSAPNALLAVQVNSAASLRSTDAMRRNDLIVNCSERDRERRANGRQ